MVRNVQHMIETLIHERHAEIVVPHELPRVLCDRTRITEAFRNLITNALKYNDKEQPRIEIGFLPEVASGAQTEKNVFYVKDNGVGIACEFHENIFRMFRRLQSAETAGQDGTGSGLAFVKKIVERHNGRIWLTSKPGCGTTFYFSLPQPEPRQSQPPVEVAA